MSCSTVLKCAALPVLLLAAVAAKAQPPHYHLIDLGIDTFGVRIDGRGDVCGYAPGGPGPSVYSNGQWRALEGGGTAQPAGLIANGHVVGTRLHGLREKHGDTAVEWMPDGRYKALLPDAVYSYGTAIQGDGTVYGAAVRAGGHAFPFSYSNGAVTELPYDPDFIWTMPTAVNRTGQLAGWAANSGSGDDPDCPIYAVAYMDGAWISLGSLGGNCGQAFGINDGGVVVGGSATSTGIGHAFRWQSGAMSDLGTLGGSYSVAEDVNGQGQIVGIAEDGAFTLHAFIWIDGVMTDLATLVDRVPPDTTLDEALSINGKGQILLLGETSFRLHAFLLDPI